MKLSEVIEAFRNDSFEIDMDNTEMVFLVQDRNAPGTNIHVSVNGTYGNLSVLFANLYVQKPEFIELMNDSVEIALKHIERKKEEAEAINH